MSCCGRFRSLKSDLQWREPCNGLSLLPTIQPGIALKIQPAFDSTPDTDVLFIIACMLHQSSPWIRMGRRVGEHRVRCSSLLIRALHQLISPIIVLSKHEKTGPKIITMLIREQEKHFALLILTSSKFKL